MTDHQSCREVINAQRALIDALHRQLDALGLVEDGDRLDWLEGEIERERLAQSLGLAPNVSLFRRNNLITRATIDEDRHAQRPVDPPPPQTDRPPVRPPVEPVDDSPPTRPPGDRLSCEGLREEVVREVVRGRDGGPTVILAPKDENWVTHANPMAQKDGDKWITTFHGDPIFPEGGADYFFSAGAYRSAGVIHDNADATYSNFIVMPNALVPGLVFREKDGEFVDQYGKMKWGYRTYGDKNTKWLYGWLNGGGTHDGISATKEHGIYCSPDGNVEFGHMLIEGWGGQAIQIASRPWDQGEHNAAWKDGDSIWIHDVCAHENGRNLGRASFPITIAFNRQMNPVYLGDDNEQQGQLWLDATRDDPHRANVVIERVHIRSIEYLGDEWLGGQLIYAKGGILVRGSDDDPNGHTFKSVVVTDSRFELVDSDRALMDFRNIENLFVGRMNMANVSGNRKVEMHKIGTLVWEGSPEMADVNVRYDGETVADGAETFVLVDGVRQ